METPKVSVVITCYNREDFIGQAIGSVLCQERSFPIEILVGDDCSTDNTRVILAELKDRYPDIIRLNLQEVNRGVGRNWASTVMMATGEYVAFLDDDDYWLDGHLNEMVSHLDAHPECGLVYTNQWVLDTDTGIKKQANRSIPKGVDVVQYLSRDSHPIIFSGVMVRKSEMDAHVCLEDYIRLNFAIQDWPTTILLAPHSEFHYLERPSIVYRVHSGSLSHPTQYEAIIAKYARERVMFDYVMKQIGIPYEISEWNRYVNGILLALAYKRKDYFKARKYAKLTGWQGLKGKCAMSYPTFLLFIFAKKIWYLKDN